MSGITVLRKSREEPRLSEERYRSLVELLHRVIWVIDEYSSTTYIKDERKKRLQ